MRILLFIALLAPPVAAQSYRDTGSAFCICPSGKRGNVGRPRDRYKTCEAFCDEGGSNGPGIDYGAIQRAEQERRDRERREREAQDEAERKAKRAMEQRKFEADKAEALSSLKGVTTGEPKLKGVDANPLGLKGVGGAHPELKGLDSPRAAEREGHPPTACRPSDDCMDALQPQVDALEAAKVDTKDVYSNLCSAYLSQPKDAAKKILEEQFTSSPKAVEKIFMWKIGDDLGIPMYLRDYRAQIDQLPPLMRMRLAAKEAASGLPSAAELSKEVKKRAQQMKKLHSFAEYMAALLACAEGPDADYLACVLSTNLEKKDALDGLPLAPASKERIKKAAGFFEVCSTNAMKEAQKAASKAVKCFKGCE